MIDLVLEAGGEQTLGLDLLLRAFPVEVADLHPRRAGHVGVLAGKRKATLLPSGQLVAVGDEFGIDQRNRRGLVVRHQIDDRDTKPDSDLRRGKADPGRAIHGREHAGQQVAQRCRRLSD